MARLVSFLCPCFQSALQCTGLAIEQLYRHHSCTAVLCITCVELRLRVIQCVEIVDHLSNDQRSALPMNIPDEQKLCCATGRTFCMCLCGLQFVATAVWCTACGKHQCLIGSGLRRSVSHFKAVAHVSVLICCGRQPETAGLSGLRDVPCRALERHQILGGVLTAVNCANLQHCSEDVMLCTKAVCVRLTPSAI